MLCSNFALPVSLNWSPSPPPMNARPALLQHNRPRTAERAPLRAWSCGIRRDDVGNEAERRPAPLKKFGVEHFDLQPL